MILDRVDRHPQNGAVALDALRVVSERLRERDDPRAVFPEIYGVITRRAALEARAPRTGFREPAWIDRLMGRFCERYLETLAWSELGAPQDCEAWDVAYAYAARRLTTPFQDVVLGLSAHINYDLALGIAQTIREHCGRDGHRDPARLARYKHDHDHVNALLRASIAECFERLEDRYGCRTGSLLWERGRPVVEPVVLGVLSVWRERVWGDVLALLRAKDCSARRRVVARMDRRSGAIARAVVAPNAAYATLEPVLPARAHALVRALVVVPPCARSFEPLVLDEGLGAGAAAVDPEPASLTA